MFIANRFAYRCVCVCATSLLSFAIAQAADDGPNSQTAPEGQAALGVEKSVLSQKANAPSTEPNAAPGMGRGMMGPGGMGMRMGDPEGPSNAAADFCKCINESDSESVKNIERALRTPLNANGLDFTETPLQEVVAQLQGDYGIPIQIDKSALEAIGVSPDEHVNINIHNVSLRSALRLVLKNLQLTYKMSNDVLMITTREEADRDLRICVYDISSISGSRDSQLDGIIDTIHSCVATDTWAKNGGGEAEIRAVRPGMLVISQTARVHEEIRDLIGTLRKMQTEPKPNQTGAHDANPSGTVVTRSYVLQIQPSDSEQARNQVRDLILASLPNETWSGRLGDGQAVTLNIIHDRVVVRHTPAVQEEVERILSDSGIATPANSVAANANGFGGGGGMGGGGGGFGGGGFFRPSTPSNHPAQRIQPGPAADDPFGE